MKSFVKFIKCWLLFPKVYREIRKRYKCTFWQAFSFTITMCKLGWVLVKYFTPQQLEELKQEWSVENETHNS